MTIIDCLLCLGVPSIPFSQSGSTGGPSNIATHAGCVCPDPDCCATQVGENGTENECLADFPPDVQLIKAMLTVPENSMFVFSRYPSLLVDKLREHGMNHMEFKQDEYEPALVYHLMNGLCACNVGQVTPSCCAVAGNVKSCLELSVMVLGAILDDVTAVGFRLAWLVVICTSLGILPDPMHRITRREFVKALHAVSSYQQATFLSSSVDYLLANVNKCPKASLVALASLHNVL
jgi:hypothetical protein